MSTDIPLLGNSETRFVVGEGYISTVRVIDFVKILLLYSAYLFFNVWVIISFHPVGSAPFTISIVIAIFTQVTIALSVYALAKHIRDGNISGSALVNQFIAGAFQYSILRYFLSKFSSTLWFSFFTMILFELTQLGLLPTLGVMPRAGNITAPHSPAGENYNVKQVGIMEKNGMSFFNSTHQQAVSLQNDGPSQRLLNLLMKHSMSLIFTAKFITPVVILVLWLVHRRYKQLNKTPRIPGTKLSPSGMVLYANVGALGVLATALTIADIGPVFMIRRIYRVYTLVDILMNLVLIVGTQTFLALEDARDVVFDRPNDVLRLAGKLILFNASIYFLSDFEDLPSSFSCFSSSGCYFRLFRLCLRLGLVAAFGIRAWKRFKLAVDEEQDFSHVA